MTPKSNNGQHRNNNNQYNSYNNGGGNNFRNNDRFNNRGNNDRFQGNKSYERRDNNPNGRPFNRDFNQNRPPRNNNFGNNSYGGRNNDNFRSNNNSSQSQAPASNVDDLDWGDMADTPTPSASASVPSHAQKESVANADNDSWGDSGTAENTAPATKTQPKNQPDDDWGDSGTPDEPKKTAIEPKNQPDDDWGDSGTPIEPKKAATEPRNQPDDDWGDSNATTDAKKMKSEKTDAADDWGDSESKPTETKNEQKAPTTADNDDWFGGGDSNNNTTAKNDNDDWFSNSASSNNQQNDSKPSFNNRGNGGFNRGGNFNRDNREGFQNRRRDFGNNSNGDRPFNNRGDRSFNNNRGDRSFSNDRGDRPFNNNRGGRFNDRENSGDRFNGGFNKRNNDKFDNRDNNNRFNNRGNDRFNNRNSDNQSGENRRDGGNNFNRRNNDRFNNKSSWGDSNQDQQMSSWGDDNSFATPGPMNNNTNFNSFQQPPTDPNMNYSMGGFNSSMKNPNQSVQMGNSMSNDWGNTFNMSAAPIDPNNPNAQPNVLDKPLNSLATNNLNRQKEKITNLLQSIGNLPNFEYIFDNKGDLSLITFEDLKNTKCECILSPQDIANDHLGCSKECLNSYINIECSSNCACEDLCSNKKFTNYIFKNTIVKQTPDKGWSLFAVDQCNPGDFLMEFCGEVITKEEFSMRFPRMDQNRKQASVYSMAIGNGAIIDSSGQGNLSRFINHSCDSNCELQKWSVNGIIRLGVFAKRALKIGEEITVDYQPFNLSLTQEQCQCKSNNCRKVIPTSTDKYISSPSQSNVSNNPNQNSDNITISALTQSNGFVTLDELAACMKHFLLSSSCSDNLKIYFTNALGNTKSELIKTKFISFQGLKVLARWLNELKIAPELGMPILKLISELPINYKDDITNTRLIALFSEFFNKNSRLMRKNMLTLDEINLKNYLLQIDPLLAKWNSLPSKFVFPFKMPPLDANGQNPALINPNIPMSAPNFDINSLNLQKMIPIDPSAQTNGQNPMLNLSSQQLASILSKITENNNKENNAAGVEGQSNSTAQTVPQEDSDLPSNWKSAKTAFGKQYYYNTVTKQTQWEKPEIEKPKQEPIVLSLDNKVGKSKAKESKITQKFKNDSSKFIVSLLNLYFKGKMSHGRITNNDDFKHLARHFTHTIMEKEIAKKGANHITFDSKTEDRISEYISTYMKKQGPVFKR